MNADIVNDLILGALMVLAFMVAVAAWFFYKIGAAVNEVARQAQEAPPSRKTGPKTWLDEA